MMKCSIVERTGYDVGSVSVDHFQPLNSSGDF